MMPITFSQFLGPPPPTTGWFPLKLGNGGYIKHISVASDGTKVCTTDTFGGYYWSASINQWVQILNAATMPPGTDNQGFSGGNAMGVDELIIDPTTTTNMWMQWNGSLYKSSSGGGTFALQTGFPTQPANIANNHVDKWGDYGAVDPNNSLVVYFSTPTNGMYRTIDGGTTWTQVTAVASGLPANVPNNPNSSSNLGSDTTTLTAGTGTKAFTHNSASFGLSLGASVQVWSAAAPAVQMLGTVTASSGATFSLNVTTAYGSSSHADWVVSNALGAGHRICFDTSGSPPTTTVAGQVRTSNVLIHTYNVGTFRSSDGGQSWAAVSTTNQALGIRQMKCDPFGVLWCVTDDFPVSGHNLSKLDGNTWTANINYLSPASWAECLAIDQANSTGSKATVKLAVGGFGGGFDIRYSADAGGTWNVNSVGSFVSSGDVDWIGAYFQANMTAFFGMNALSFDPSISGLLRVASEGQWTCTPVASTSNITVTQETRGIEEFIGNKIISANGGACLVGVWDFPGFYKDSAHFGSYQSALTLLPGNSQAALQRCYSYDWLWSNPQIIVNIVQDGTGFSNNASQSFAGKSIDGGKTWTAFTTQLTDGTTAGGDIAIADANTIVWLQAGNQALPKITLNAGVTWNPISIPGGTPTSFWGPITTSSTQYAKFMDSDKANGNIYIYNVSVNGGADGFFKFTQATQVWSTKMSLGIGALANINGILKSSGVADNLFFTAGVNAPPHPSATHLFYYTTDGWTTSNQVNGFLEVQAFGFGKAFLTYPTIFAVGWRSGVYGIWMCKDFNTGTGNGTWTRCLDNKGSPYPLGVLTNVTDIDGDPSTAGLVYVLTNGGGFWGRFT